MSATHQEAAESSISRSGPAIAQRPPAKVGAVRKQKLLVVVGTVGEIGGAERQALYLVEHLARLGACEVEVLAFQDGTPLRTRLDKLGVPVHVFPYYFRWPRAKRAKALARLAWLLRFRIKPDALLPFVSIHSKTTGLVWPFSGARFCWWNQQDEGRDLTGTEMERRILRRASCITSNSEVGRDFLAETYGLPPQSILVYNNGTPVPDLSAIRSDWRVRLALERRKIVTMIANVTATKDHATLLAAWAVLKRSFPEKDKPVLLIAGYLNDRATVTALMTQAFELGLSSEDVRFLGAIEDVPALLSETDVVVHSSVLEGCPNAVCEAMAAARPVVATNIPGCRQALGAVGERWLAAPRNANELAAKMLELLEDSDLMKRVGEANRQRIESDFTVAGMNDFFQRLIERGLKSSLSLPELPLRSASG